jgi:DNA-directed RNA polymerase subunit RPC12/RpoP
VNISDNVGLDIESIQLYINDDLIEKDQYNFNKTNSILTFYWDTLDYNDGIYEVEVVAYDKQGNKSERKISVEIDNGLINWRKWGPWIIFLGVSIGISVSLYIFAEKKGKDVVEGIKERYAEKIKQEKTEKLDVMKKIKELEQEQHKKELTLHCKYCDSWFSSSKFDIVCPNCQRDEVYVAYNCINCGEWTHKNEPGTDYECSNCAGVKLVRRDKKEIKEILGSQKRKVLQEFNKKKDKYSLLD